MNIINYNCNSLIMKLNLFYMYMTNPQMLILGLSGWPLDRFVVLQICINLKRI